MFDEKGYENHPEDWVFCDGEFHYIHDGDLETDDESAFIQQLDNDLIEFKQIRFEIIAKYKGLLKNNIFFIKERRIIRRNYQDA